MDLLSAVQTINTLLSTTQPDTFSSSWIHKHAPHVYRFVRNNLRTEYGGIDWDAFTRSLDRKMQPRWQASHRGRPATCVRGRNAVEILLHTYHDKLYTFLSPLNMPDEQVRDVISIALVRIAQRGNEIG